MGELWRRWQELVVELRKLSVGARTFVHVFDDDGCGGVMTAPVLVLPRAFRTPGEKARELQRLDLAVNRIAAYRVEMVVGLARDRSAADDPPPGSVGAASPEWAHDQGEDRLPGVSEFFPDELALILNCSRAEATSLTEISLTLAQRLPSTLAALANGALDWPRARALARELGWPARDTEPAIVAQVEATVLPQAAELSITTLRALTRRELMRLDAAAAERRRKDALRTADVTLHAAADGMTELRAFMPAPEAAAVLGTVDAEARMAKRAGDPRPIGVLRAMVLSDRVLRPVGDSRPPVTAAVTVVAPLPTLSRPPCDHPGGGPVEPGEIDGQPITAAQLRELLTELDVLCPGGLQAPTAGSLDIAIVEEATGGLRATVTRPELERLVRRGCPDHADVACGCPVLDRPPPVDRYRHSSAQERFVRTRDRTCRHPGCRSRAAWADLDHVVAHAEGGATDCANLCCLCRRHHRLKTHARGWRFAMSADGILSVTTPSGITRTTRPPGMRPPDMESPGMGPPGCPPPQPVIPDAPPF